MTGAALEWVARAKQDLAVVDKLLDDEALTNISAFHAQQCIEKCYKALIEFSGNSVPKTHDLLRLSAIVSMFEEILADETVLIELSTIYLDARYPASTGFLPSGKPDLQDVKRYRETASAILDVVNSRIE